MYKSKINSFLYFYYTIIFILLVFNISILCSICEYQRIFVIDSISSFIMGLIYPFIIYLVPTGLRIISLKAKEKKNLQILYSLSDKIPIF